MQPLRISSTQSAAQSLPAPALSALAPLLSTSPASMQQPVGQTFALSVMGLQRGLTPAKARNSPQVSGLRRDAPGDLAEALGNLLTFTAQQFNVVRNLTDVQIMLLTSDLIERYWHWRINEFAYVCREAISGRWGKVYDRLDPPTVQDWCAAYETQVRGEQIAAEAESRAANFKAAEADTGPPTDMARAYLRAQLEAKTDDELQAGISYYLRNPDATNAPLKKQLAEAVLADREKKKAAGPTAEETEAEYQRFKAGFIARQVIAAGEPEEPN